MTSPSLEASTAARYVHNLCQLLRQAGEPVEHLLAGTGLQADTLTVPGQFVDHDTLDRFLLNVEQQTRESLPGLLLGHHLNISAHGAVGYAGLTTPNAIRAIEIAARYFPLITSLVSLKLRHSEQDVQLLITPTPGISARTEQFVMHTLLASFDVMGSFLVGDLGLRAALTSSEERELPQRLGPAIRCITFNQREASFTMPRAQLEGPFALADPTAHAQAIERCDNELQALDNQKSLAGRLLPLLAVDAPPTQETLAAQLGMSSRTLHRRLLDEGVSFRTLLQQARIQRAKYYLRHDRLSVTETAFRLNYQDSANFTRAFRKATGMTPSTFIDDPLAD